MGKKRQTKRYKAAVLEQPNQENNVVCNGSSISLEDITTGSLILENIFSFLDTPSLKACRLVSHAWDEACLPLLSKQTYLNIASFYHAVYRKQEQLISRAELYSSWKLTVENGQNQFPSIYGAQVKSLSVHDIDLSKKCIAWIRELLSSWCPRVTKLHLHFQGIPENENYNPLTMTHRLRWKEFYAFGKSLKSEHSLSKFQTMLELNKNHSFHPFVQLPNLHTISFGSACGRLNSLLVFNIICSCPNLKHLFLNGIHHLREEVKESGFRILEYLSRRPDITAKLESFSWEVRMGHIPKQPFSFPRYGRKDEQVRELYPEEERQPVRLLTDTGEKKRAIPAMQFSDKLKYLQWDVLWVERNGILGGLGLLPGTLDKTVAGNLRKLSTRKAVMDPTSFPTLEADRRAHEEWTFTRRRVRGWHYCSSEAPNLNQQVKCLQIDFLLMPKLVELELGLRSVYTISLSDLLDAAPNLRKLTITGCECHDILNDLVETNGRHAGRARQDLPSDDIWQGSSNFLLAMKPHSSLKFLDAGVSMRTGEILQTTVQKFPNLEELWMGPHFNFQPSKTKLELESVFRILQELHSLQRLKWNYKGPRRVELDDLIGNLLGAGRLTASLQRYELKLSQSQKLDEYHVGLEGYWRRKEELLDCLQRHNWPTHSKCQISVSWDNPYLFGFAGGKCPHREHADSDCYGVIQSFLTFLQDEGGLPIRFENPEPPSPEELRVRAASVFRLLRPAVCIYDRMAAEKNGLEQ
jgi:hypothetical protein